MDDRIVFTGSVSPDELPALNQTPGDWWLSQWRSDREQENLMEAFARYRRLDNLYRIINLDYKMVNEGLLHAVRDAGYPLSVWTVNNEESLRRMMACGAWNITTRKPLLALKIRKELFGI